MYFLSIANAHVLSAKSGFGQIAARMRVRSPKEYLLYRVDNHVDRHKGTEHATRVCDLAAPDLVSLAENI